MNRTSLREAVTKTVCITSFSEMEFRRRERGRVRERRTQTFALKRVPYIHSWS